MTGDNLVGRLSGWLSLAAELFHEPSASSFGDSSLCFRLPSVNRLSVKGVTTWSHQPRDLEFALSGVGVMAKPFAPACL